MDRTFNQWLIDKTPGISPAVKQKLAALPGEVLRHGPITDLAPHLREALPPSLKARQALPNVTIAFRLGLTQPVPTPGLEEFFERVYAELVDNALREFVADAAEREALHKQPRAYELRIDAFLKSDRGDQYAVQVLDNGRGMPRELVNYILRHIDSQRDKPYKLPLDYRLDEGRHIGGYGLIMAVNYVLRLKGAFSIRAQEGHGTKIRFDLPVECLHDIYEFIPELAV